MKIKLFFLIILIQIGMIFLFLFKIQQKNNNTLGISINFIDPKAIQRTPVEGLKYFYEPKANSSEEIKKSWLPYVAKYTINNDALNERFNYDIQKKEDVFRIITLGDSFTFGQNVSTDRNWTELLEDYLNTHQICNKVKKYEVINLGVYSYDTQYEVERYRIRGQKYNPDLVVWTFIDLERINEQMIPLVQQNDATAVNKELEKKGVYNDNWRIAREDMIRRIGQTGIINFQEKQIKRLNEYYKGQLIYVAMPNKPEYISLLQQKAKERAHSYFFQPYIQWKQPGLFLPDDHFNDTGHKKMTHKNSILTLTVN